MSCKEGSETAAASRAVAVFPRGPFQLASSANLFESATGNVGSAEADHRTHFTCAFTAIVCGLDDISLETMK